MNIMKNSLCLFYENLKLRNLYERVVLTLSRRVTHYCVVVILDMLILSLFMSYLGTIYSIFSSNSEANLEKNVSSILIVDLDHDQTTEWINNFS